MDNTTYDKQKKGQTKIFKLLSKRVVLQYGSGAGSYKLKLFRAINNLYKQNEVSTSAVDIHESTQRLAVIVKMKNYNANDTIIKIMGRCDFSGYEC